MDILTTTFVALLLGLMLAIAAAKAFTLLAHRGQHVSQMAPEDAYSDWQIKTRFKL